MTQNRNSKAFHSVKTVYFNRILVSETKRFNEINILNFDSFHLDVNVAGAYQILLQYFFRRIDENDLTILMDDLDHVNFSRRRIFVMKNILFQLAASLKRYPSDKVLRLLWAFSQIQYSQAAYALKSENFIIDRQHFIDRFFLFKVWFYLMFPLVENRTYNPFVIGSISQLTRFEIIF